MESKRDFLVCALILYGGFLGCAAWTNEAELLEDFSFNFDQSDAGKSRWNESQWDLKGSAEVNESKIVLTSNAQQIGSVWHRSPLDVANWEVELEFNIPDKWLKADGFGFLYTEKPEHGRAYGAALDFTGLVVAVDTFQNYLNKIYPCPLTVQIFNGSQKLDLWADGVDTAIVAHPVVLNGRENLPVTMKIRYQDYALTVSLTVSAAEGPVNYGPFRIHGVHIPRGYYLGFGAFCGDFWIQHSVVRFETRKLDGPEDSFIRGPPRTNLLDYLHGHPSVAWIRIGENSKPLSGVVLDLFPKSSDPVYMARIYEQGRYIPGVFLDDSGFLAFRETESLEQNKTQDTSAVEVLSYRRSRDTVISWPPFSANQMEVPGTMDRMVAIGFSAEGDLLYICKAQGSDSETSVPSRLGVFSLSSGLCTFRDGKDDLPLASTSEFSVLLIS